MTLTSPRGPDNGGTDGYMPFNYPQCNKPMISGAGREKEQNEFSKSSAAIGVYM